MSTPPTVKLEVPLKPTVSPLVKPCAAAVTTAGFALVIPVTVVWLPGKVTGSAAVIVSCVSRFLI